MGRRRAVMAVVAFALAGVSAGCGRPSTTVAATDKTFYDGQAVTFAQRIPGCQGPAAAPVPSASPAGMVSVAVCHLAADIVVLYTWIDPASERQANRTISGPLMYRSTGAGWTQIMGDDDSEQAQLSVATTVAKALSGAVKTTSPT